MEPSGRRVFSRLVNSEPPTLTVTRSLVGSPSRRRFSAIGGWQARSIHTRMPQYTAIHCNTRDNSQYTRYIIIWSRRVCRSEDTHGPCLIAYAFFPSLAGRHGGSSLIDARIFPYPGRGVVKTPGRSVRQPWVALPEGARPKLLLWTYSHGRPLRNCHIKKRRRGFCHQK